MSFDNIKNLTFMHYRNYSDHTVCYRAIEIKWWGYDKYYLHIIKEGNTTRLTGSFASLTKNNGWTLISHQESYLHRLIRTSCWRGLSQGRIGLLITKDSRVILFKPTE